MNRFINNKKMFLNSVVSVALIGLLLTRLIPLSVIIFVGLMAEGAIIITLKFKGNVIKSFLYSIGFMTVVMTIFFVLIFTQVDNKKFMEMILFIL